MVNLTIKVLKQKTGSLWLGAMSEDLGETIAQNAAQPRRLKGDEGEAEAHSMQDLIAADNHLASKRVAKKPYRAIGFAKMTGPGAT